MNSQNQIPNITVTIIFDGFALNRDENIGGNFQSIKKMNVNGSIVPYLSKGSMRHHLFNTLIQTKNWKEAALKKDGKVIQFDVISDGSDILTCEELDAFGYMMTGANTLTRKGPVHITKSVALYPYMEDQAFYANHNLVERLRRTGYSGDPMPFSKQEHSGFFKVSFTIDSQIFGKDSWIVKERYVNKNILSILVEEPNEVSIPNVVLESDENGKKTYRKGGYSILVEGNVITFPEKGLGKLESKKEEDGEEVPVYNLSGKPEAIIPNNFNKDGNRYIINTKIKPGKKQLEFQDLAFKISGEKKDDTIFETKLNSKKIELIYTNESVIIPDNLVEEIEEGISIKEEILAGNTLSFEAPIQNEDGTVTVIASEEPVLSKTQSLKFTSGTKPKKITLDKEYKEDANVFTTKEDNVIKIEPRRKVYYVEFNVNEKMKRQRISDILEVIHNGIMAKSSGEPNTLAPLFLIAGSVKVPSPIFHSYLDVRKQNGKFEVYGIKDALRNSWLDGNIYIVDSERLSAQEINWNEIKNNRSCNGYSSLTKAESWKAFLDAANLTLKLPTT